MVSFDECVESFDVLTCMVCVDTIQAAGVAFFAAFCDQEQNPPYLM